MPPKTSGGATRLKTQAGRAELPNRNTYVILRFLVGPLKRLKGTGDVNLNASLFNKYIQNIIILTCNQCKNY